jgi:hypothetical protein
MAAHHGIFFRSSRLNKMTGPPSARRRAARDSVRTDIFILVLSR